MHVTTVVHVHVTLGANWLEVLARVLGWCARIGSRARLHHWAVTPKYSTMLNPSICNAVAKWMRLRQRKRFVHRPVASFVISAKKRSITILRDHMEQAVKERVVTADKTRHVICFKCQSRTHHVFRLFTWQSNKYLTCFASLCDEYNTDLFSLLHTNQFVITLRFKYWPSEKGKPLGKAKRSNKYFYTIRYLTTYNQNPISC